MQKPQQPPAQGSAFGSYQMTKPEEAELEGMQDHLLKQFSASQREYIIKNLYPELKKALIHFISEAKRHEQIDEGDQQE